MKTVAYVTASMLKLHEDPNISSSVLALIPCGQTVTLANQQDGWSAVDFNGTSGFVDSTYIRVTTLLADASHWQAAPDWSQTWQDGRFAGVIVKASQGMGSDGGWFATQWPAVREAGGGDYGTNWFRGAYHYLAFSEDGGAQAENYLTIVGAAGGFASGDLLPVVDVELGPANSDNRKASAQQVIDCTTAWAAKIQSELGKKPILYGRSAMQALGIRDRMGCQYLWNPSYTDVMVAADDIGWPSEQVMLWQYTDGTAPAQVGPREVPGVGAGDISRFLGGDVNVLAQVLAGFR